MRKWNWKASRLFLWFLCAVALLVIACATSSHIRHLQNEAQQLRDELARGAVMRSAFNMYKQRAETLTLYARYLECEAQPWGVRSKYSHCRREG